MLPTGKIFDKLTLCEVEVAINENHTSSFCPPTVPQEGEGNVAENVALCVVPAVTAVQVNVGFTVSPIAVIHSSFGGGGGGVTTQILKLATVVNEVEFVKTRT